MEYINKIIKESLNELITIKHYSGREFLKMYHNYIKEINSFKYFDSGHDFDESNNVYFFVLYLDKKMIGLAHIRKNPYIVNTYWLSYLSILDGYMDMGYASKLSEYIIKWFSENNLQFETSSYSETGYLKLKPLFNKLTKKYNVPFIDKDSKI